MLWYDKILQHKLSANLLMLALLLIGSIAFFNLNRQLFPNFQLPIISASISWDNADAQSVYDKITSKADAALQQLSGIEFSRSLSQSGSSQLNLIVKSSADLNDVQKQVESSLQALALPEGAEVGTVSSRQLNEAVSSLVLYGPLLQADLYQLSLAMQQSLLAAGINDFQIQGQPQQQRVIEVNPTLLQELDITLAQFSQSLQQQINATPAGNFEVGENSTELLADPLGYDIESLQQLLLPIADNNNLRLGQVAKIYDRYQNKSELVQFDGENGIIFNIFRALDQDSLSAAKELDTWLASFVTRLPPNVAIHNYNQNWLQVQSQLALVVKNGSIGMLLVMLILFLVLRARYAFWVAMGIPISILGTFAVIYALGISLNSISLFGFIIAIGIIVDDAIVVAEDTAYLEQQGLSRGQAAMAAAKRMFPSVFAASLTTIAAFLPLILIGGNLGRFLLDIPIVICAAIFISIIECFFILPGHLAHTSKSSKADSVLSRRQQQQAKLRQWMENKFSQFTQAFEQLLQSCLQQKFNVSLVLLSLLLICSSALYYERIRFVASAELDSQNLRLDVDFRPQTDYQQASAALLTLQQQIRQFDQQQDLQMLQEVLLVMDNPQTPKTGQLLLYFANNINRQISNQQFIEQLNQRLIRPNAIENIRNRSRSFGPLANNGFSLSIVGKELANLQNAAKQIKQSLKSYPELANLEDNLPDASGQYQLSLTDFSQQQNISMRLISQQLSQLLQGVSIGRSQTLTEDIDVKVQLPDHIRQGSTWFEHLPIYVAGEYLPLSSLVTLDFQASLPSIQTQDGQLRIDISADYLGFTDLEDFQQQIYEDSLQELLPQLNVEIEFNNDDALEEFLLDAFLAVLLSLTLIYFILAWVFASWRWPWAVLLTMPFGVIGGILGHGLLDMPLSIISIFGLIGLAGIVINDSIILVTVFLRYIKQGKNTVEAAIEAACQRLRPVLLTSATTIAGLTPLIISNASNLQLIQPIAVSIVFGLLFSTLLILICLPMLLILFANKAVPSTTNSNSNADSNNSGIPASEQIV